MLNTEEIEIKNFAPIIIPTLNRFQHFKECVESLRNCTHADKTDLIIGLDYPPSEKYVDGWDQIKNYLSTLTGFNKIIVFEHKENLGAVGNGEFLLDYIYKKYDTFIYTEDDNVFSPCFLDYINKCLDFYKSDKSANAICGYSKITDFPSKNNTIKINADFVAWGFASTKDKYKELLDSIKPDYRRIVCNHNIKVFRLWNYEKLFLDFVNWLDNKDLDRPCDITFAISNIINCKYVVMSTIPMVRNMGYDGSGENCSDDGGLESKKIITDATSYEIKVSDVSCMKEASLFIANKRNEGMSRKEKIFAHKLMLISFLFGYNIMNFYRRRIHNRNILKYILKKMGCFDFVKNIIKGN